MAGIRPLGDLVLVELTGAKEVVKGGILIPETSKEKPTEGVIVAVGRKRGEDGADVPFDVCVGDVVLLPRYGGTVVKVDGKTLQLVRESDLLGVVS